MTTSLNPVAVLAWIDALESGEFKQTTGELHNRYSGGYCCLGVACVVAKRLGIIEQLPWEEERSSPRYNDAVLNFPVMRWLGFTDQNPVIVPYDVSTTGTSIVASSANDSLNMTFPQIAAALRELLRQQQENEVIEDVEV